MRANPIQAEQAGGLRRAFPGADRLIPLAFLLGISLVLSLTTAGFASGTNLRSIAQQQAVIIIIVVGQALVMIAGGIDLSVGSVVALVTVVAAKLMRDAHFSPAMAVLCGLGVGAACGMINGIVTTRARVPAFIATLGMMGMAKGVSLAVSGGVNISELPEGFKSLGYMGKQGMITVLLFSVITLVAIIVGHIILSRTSFGRAVYAIGGNAEAARLSGINVNRRLVAAFTFCGLLTGLAGVVLLIRLGLGSPTNGEGYELLTISAAVIGGTSLFGGQGTIPESIVGAMIIAVIGNGCILSGVSNDWQYFIIGAMTIVAVFVDRLRRGKTG